MLNVEEQCAPSQNPSTTGKTRKCGAPFLKMVPHFFVGRTVGVLRRNALLPRSRGRCPRAPRRAIVFGRFSGSVRLKRFASLEISKHPHPRLRRYFPRKRGKTRATIFFSRTIAAATNKPVIAGLVPAIHGVMDARNKSGHDSLSRVSGSTERPEIYGNPPLFNGVR